MSLKVITPPTSEQISLAEARLHLRVTPDDDSPPAHPDDTLIESLITAARQYCERYLQRALAPQTLEVVLDEFVPEIALPMPPVASVTSVKYVDGDSIEQTLSAALYTLDNENDNEVGFVLPAIDTEWPTPLDAINSVRVRYVAGYTTPTDSPNDRPLPATIRAAMLLLIGNWYENREAVVIGTSQNELSFAVEALLLPYRLRLSLA